MLPKSVNLHQPLAPKANTLILQMEFVKPAALDQSMMNIY
jgi:hypothetical protein